MQATRREPPTWRVHAGLVEKNARERAGRAWWREDALDGARRADTRGRVEQRGRGLTVLATCASSAHRNCTRACFARAAAVRGSQVCALCSRAISRACAGGLSSGIWLAARRSGHLVHVPALPARSCRSTRARQAALARLTQSPCSGSCIAFDRLSSRLHSLDPSGHARSPRLRRHGYARAAHVRLTCRSLAIACWAAAKRSTLGSDACYARKISGPAMTFRAVPSSQPAVRCVLTGRRFHQWVLSFIDPQACGLTNLERKCADCGARQHTHSVPERETRELPRTLWCLGDWAWQEGELEP